MIERSVRSRFRPEEVLFCACGVVLVALMAATGAWIVPTEYHARFLACFGVITALLLGGAYRRERARHERALALQRAVAPTLRALRDFLPLVVALVLYGCLHDLTPVLCPKTADA